MSLVRANSTPAAVAIHAKSERFGHVDTLRGALLVLMAINHIPCDLHPYTDHVFGYVSGAEGFVFLSGLMCGYVYSRRYYKRGAEALRIAAIGRARTTYLYHVVTFVAVLVGLLAYRAYFEADPVSAAPVLLEHPWRSLCSGLALLQQPSLFDILPLYCVFLLGLPYIILGCARGHRAAILGGSVLLWLMVNFLSTQQPLIQGVVNTGSFNLVAWQLLFVMGAVFGHAWAAGQRLISAPNRWTVSLALIAAAALFSIRHAYLAAPIPREWLDWATNKNNLAPVRAVNAGLLFYLFYAISVYAPNWINWRPLAFLGSHSIFVFAAHVFVAYVLLTFPETFQVDATARAVGTVVMIGSLFVAAAIHQAMQNHALGARQGGPAGVSVG